MNAKANESSFIEMLSTQVLMQLAIGVILTDETGRIVWSNPRQQWLSGLEEGQLRGKAFAQIAPFAQLGISRIVDRVLRTGQPHFHFVTHRGIFCRTEVLPLRENQRVCGAAILFYDREGEGFEKLEYLKASPIVRQAEQSATPGHYLAFEWAEQRALLFVLTQVMDALPFPVVLFDPALRILYSNAHFADHYAAGEKPVGKSVLDFIPSDDHELLRRQLPAVLQSAEKADQSSPRSLSLPARQGVYFVNKVDEHTGLEAGVLVILPAEKMDSLDKRDAFADKFETLCQFSGKLIHDLRNPLTALMCQLDFLRNEDLYEKGGIHKFQKGIDLIQQQVHDIDGILTNIESFGIAGGDEPSEASLQDILLNARVVAELQRPHKSVHVQADIADDLPWIRCEALRLQKAIVEILLNALEAAGESGQVTMAAQFLKAEKVIEIQISDNGPGIPQQLADKIFDPFFSTKKRHGAGLGLTVAYAVVKQHGGFIKVQTLPMKGTKVNIRLPLAKDVK